MRNVGRNTSVELGHMSGQLLRTSDLLCPIVAPHLEPRPAQSKNSNFCIGPTPKNFSKKAAGNAAGKKIMMLLMCRVTVFIHWLKLDVCLTDALDAAYAFHNAGKAPGLKSIGSTTCFDVHHTSVNGEVCSDSRLTDSVLFA